MFGTVPVLRWILSPDEILLLTICVRLAAKALEIFLQDLCDRAYDVTKARGAKTVSVPHMYGRIRVLALCLCFAGRF